MTEEKRNYQAYSRTADLDQVRRAFLAKYRREPDEVIETAGAWLVGPIPAAPAPPAPALDEVVG